MRLPPTAILGVSRHCSRSGSSGKRENNMSLVSMVDTKLAIQQAQDPQKPSPDKPVGVQTNIVNQITRWIPTETISVYVALLALVAPLVPHSSSYASRWTLFWLR